MLFTSLIGILHGACPEILRVAQDDRRAQDDIVLDFV